MDDPYTAEEIACKKILAPYLKPLNEAGYAVFQGPDGLSIWSRSGGVEIRSIEFDFSLKPSSILKTQIKRIISASKFQAWLDLCLQPLCVRFDGHGRLILSFWDAAEWCVFLINPQTGRVSKNGEPEHGPCEQEDNWTDRKIIAFNKEWFERASKNWSRIFLSEVAGQFIVRRSNGENLFAVLDGEPEAPADFPVVMASLFEFGKSGKPPEGWKIRKRSCKKPASRAADLASKQVYEVREPADLYADPMEKRRNRPAIVPLLIPALLTAGRDGLDYKKFSSKHGISLPALNVWISVKGKGLLERTSRGTIRVIAGKEKGLKNLLKASGR